MTAAETTPLTPCPSPAVLPRHGSALLVRTSARREASSSSCTPPTVAPAFPGPEGRLFSHQAKSMRRGGPKRRGKRAGKNVAPDGYLPDNISSVILYVFLQNAFVQHTRCAQRTPACFYKRAALASGALSCHGPLGNLSLSSVAIESPSIHTERRAGRRGSQTGI